MCCPDWTISVSPSDEAIAKHSAKRHDISMARRRVTTCLTAVFMLALLGRFAFAQQEPTAAEAQRQLLQLTVPDSMETNVPTPVQHAITKFKKALAFQTDAIVSQLPADATAISVKQHLSARMPSPTVGRISDEQWKKMDEQNSAREPGTPNNKLASDLSSPCDLPVG
jgi:hypothetical protein